MAGGVAEVQPDLVTVLADAAENVREIDVARAEAARQRAEEHPAKQVRRQIPMPTWRWKLPCAAPTCAWMPPGAIRSIAAHPARSGTSQEKTSNLWRFSRKTWALTWARCYTRVAEGDQIVLQEPTVVAIVVEEQKMVAWGQEAQDMFGRVPESIEVARPLQNGVIADYEVTEYLLEALLRKLSGPMRFFGPRVMITVPYGVTSVESRAVHEAVLQAGSREAYLIQQPLAAALGVDLPIGTPSGNMVICLGGGATQAAVLAMYGIVSPRRCAPAAWRWMKPSSAMCARNTA